MQIASLSEELTSTSQALAEATAEGARLAGELQVGSVKDLHAALAEAGRGAAGASRLLGGGA